MAEYKHTTFGKAFLTGNIVGVVCYAGACNMQAIPFVRRPWYLIATALGTGFAFQAYQNFYDGVREELFRKRVQFVKERQARYLTNPDEIRTGQRKIYEQIVKDIEATQTQNQ